MYESHWKLTRRPFDDGSATDFYFPSRTHHAALLKLRYLIDQQKGTALIVGEHGLGKTFLTHVLEQECRPAGIGPFLRLVFPQLTPLGMLTYLADRLGADRSDAKSDGALLTAMEARLKTLQEEQRHPVFLIDDAHHLQMEHLHLLRLLLNLREEGEANFSIILSGRTELLASLQRFAAFDQRIVVRAALEPLPEEEIEGYVSRRFEAAGRKGSPFDHHSIRTLWELSQGIPRRINQLCDLALLVGYVDELGSISPVELEAAAEELMSVAA